MRTSPVDFLHLLLYGAEEEQTPRELCEEAKEVVNTAAKKHVSKRKKQKAAMATK